MEKSVVSLSKVYTSRLLDRRIRLLRLLPGSSSAALKYELAEYGLDSVVEFQSLSYTWGDPTPHHIIECNGEQIGIADCLHDILQQFCKDGDQQLFWTDAICINQEDLGEKTEQVRLMTDIYQAASQVVVWLGKEEDTDQSALDLLEQLLDKLDLPKTVNDLMLDPSIDIEALGLPDSGDERWLHVIKLFERPWFYRVWTVQEFLFAKRSHVRIGKLRFEWDLLFAVASNVIRSRQLAVSILGPNIANKGVGNLRSLWLLKIRHKPFLFNQGRTMADSHQNPLTRWAKQGLFAASASVFKLLSYTTNVKMPQWSDPKPPLYELLQSTSRRYATMPQDKVFSVLGLAQDGRVDLIDYHKSVAEALIDAAKMSLGVVDGITIPLGVDIGFLFGIEDVSTIPGLPTWVPDYTHRFTPLTGLNVGVPSWRQPSLNNVNGYCDGQILQLQGRFIDSVKTVYQNDSHEFRISDASEKGKALGSLGLIKLFIGRPQTTENLMEFEQRCWDIVQALGSYPTAETLEEAYYQAMTFEQGDVDTGSLKMRDCWRIYRDTLPIQALLFSQALKKSREGGLGANQSLVETTQQAEAPEKAQINSFPSNIETGPAIAEDIPLAVHQLRQILRENCGDLGVDGSQAGSFDPMTTPLTAEHFKKANLRVPDILQDPPGPSIIQYITALSPYVETFEQRSQVYTYGRRFGTTFEGYIGWVPRGAREGDIIVLFNGSTVPFVVRRTFDKEGVWDGMFTFVGACYFRGFMGGGKGAWGFEREGVWVHMR